MLQKPIFLKHNYTVLNDNHTLRILNECVIEGITGPKKIKEGTIDSKKRLKMNHIQDDVMRHDR